MPREAGHIDFGIFHPGLRFDSIPLVCLAIGAFAPSAGRGIAIGRECA